MGDRFVEIESLWKFDGYEVTAVIRTSFGDVKAEIKTGMDTPEKAIEAARFRLREMGEQIAEYLKEPGSLK